MPKGKKHRTYEAAFQTMLDEVLEGRVLDFDEPAALHAATIAAGLRVEGSPVEIRDTMIAGIVAARRGVLATRNTKHFAGAGVALVDPWYDNAG
jgi:predicted nucleic acid-binding protein